jgi:hypothetical protein
MTFPRKRATLVAAIAKLWKDNLMTDGFEDVLLATKVSVDHEGFTKTFTVDSVSFLFLADGSEQVLSIQRSSEDDDGVCLVVSPSQACAYDTYTEISLTRRGLGIHFTPDGEQVFGVGSVLVTFDIDDELWRKVRTALTTICAGKPFFKPPSRLSR